MPDIYLKFKTLDIPAVVTVHSTLKSQTHVAGTEKLKKEHGKKTTVEKLTLVGYPYIQLLEKFYLKKTKNLIAVSQWITQFIDKNSKSIKVIHNGIDTKKFRPGKKSMLDTNKPVVLFCGRLYALKGIKTIIDSMSLVLQKHDVFFAFSGSGDKKQWEQLIQQKNIPKENYCFLNYVPYEKIHELYQSADIFILPSFTESFPLTVLEAMASGLPVIATNIGGIPEMINHGKNGLLIEAGNHKQLAKNIIALLENKKLAKSLGSKARSHVVQNFDVRIMANKTKQFYKEVLAQ